MVLNIAHHEFRQTLRDRRLHISMLTLLLLGGTGLWTGYAYYSATQAAHAEAAADRRTWDEQPDPPPFGGASRHVCIQIFTKGEKISIGQHDISPFDLHIN